MCDFASVRVKRPTQAEKKNTEGKETDGNYINVYFTNRLKIPFPVTNPYFGATAGILGRFI